MTTTVPAQRAFAVDIGAIERACQQQTGFTQRTEEGSFPFGLSITGEFITTDNVEVVLPNAIYNALLNAKTRTMTMVQYQEFYRSCHDLRVNDSVLKKGQYAFEGLFTPGLVSTLCSDISALPMARKMLMEKTETIDIYETLLDETTIGYRPNALSLVFLVQTDDNTVFAVPILYKVAHDLTMTLEEALKNGGFSNYKQTATYECLTTSSFYSLLHRCRCKGLLEAHSAARQGVAGLAQAMSLKETPYSKELMDTMMKMFLITLIQEDKTQTEGMDRLNALCPSLRELVNERQFESFLAQIPHRPYTSLFGEEIELPQPHELSLEELTHQMNEYVNFGARNVSAYYDRVNILPQKSHPTPNKFLWIKLETLTPDERKLAGQVINLSRVMWQKGLAASPDSVSDLLQQMPGYRIPQVALIGQVRALKATEIATRLKRARGRDESEPTTPSKKQNTGVPDDGISMLINQAVSSGSNALRELGIRAFYYLSPNVLPIKGPGDEPEDEPVECNVQ